MHFPVNSRLIKQIDGCPMGGSLSVVFSDIFMCKIGEDVVVPAKPIFYKRYVDDTYIRSRKNVNDELFQNLNCYHTNIKLTLEENPRKFLDTEIIRKNHAISTQVFTKLTKFHVHWSSKIPTNYKRNAITIELHRAKKIATNFDKELRRIKTKFLHDGYPVNFINGTFFRFNKEKEELLIAKWLFDETKLVVIRLPFAPRNEKFSERFISKLQTFTNGKVRYNIIWNTRKMQSLFNNKDKVQHLSCVIYEGVCTSGADYIGETIRNVKIKWHEHESGIDKNSECFKHLQEHLSHGFQGSVISIAPRNTFKWKILEAYFIKIMVPSLNSQMNSDVLTLFRNGIT